MAGERPKSRPKSSREERRAHERAQRALRKRDERMATQDGPMMPLGAVDLGALKGDPRQQEKVAKQHLQQGLFLCICGKRIEDEGWLLFGVWKGQMMTPMGPQDGAIAGTSAFCSETCGEYLKALRVGLTFQMPGVGDAACKVLGRRKIEATTWFDAEGVEE